MKRIYRLFTIIALVVFPLCNSLMAQPLPGGTNIGGGGPVGPPTGKPLSGPIGDSIMPLIILAFAYALVKLYQAYKLRNSESQA